MTPTSLRSPLALSFAFAFIADPAWSQARGIAYAVDVAASDHLWAIDLTSGNATDLGATGFTTIQALSFHPDGRLLGIDEQTLQLVQLDLRTGAGTAVISLSEPVHDAGFAIDALGRGWVSSEPHEEHGEEPKLLFSLELASGELKVFAELGADVHGLCAIGSALYGVGSERDSIFHFDTQSKRAVEVGPFVVATGDFPAVDVSSDGTLWMLDVGGGIYRLDRFTGEATPVSTTITGCTSMAIPLWQVCAYSVDSDATDSLFAIDLLTGAAIEIGPTGISDIEGLAFHPDGRLFGIDDPSNQLVRIDLRSGAATVIGGLGISVSDPGFAIDANGTAYLCSGTVTVNSIFTVDLGSGAASLVGSTGRAMTGLAAIGTSLYGLGVAGTAQAALMSVSPSTGVATPIGDLVNDALTGGSLDATPDGQLWGIGGSGVIARISATTGELIVVAQTIPSCEGLAIPPVCDTDETVLHATEAGFDLEWTAVDGGGASSGSFELEAHLPRAALPASLGGAELTVLLAGIELGGTHVLDETGRFVSASGASPAIDASVSAKNGELEFEIEGLDVAGILGLENESITGALLAAVRVRLRSSGVVLVDAANVLPLSFESAQELDAEGSFQTKSSRSYGGAAAATKVGAKQGEGDAFDLSFQGTLFPHGGGPLVPSAATLEGTEPVLILRVGAAEPIEIPVAALAFSGAGPKTKWKLSGDVPRLKSLSYSASKGDLKFALEDVVGTGIPAAAKAQDGEALEHVLPVEVLVATAGLPQRFALRHRLTRSSASSGTWK